MTRLVVDQQQSAEPGAGPSRIGEAADDEFLAGFALELQPVPSPTGPVGRIGTLRDNPLPTAGTRLAKVRLAIGVLVLGKAQRAGESQQAAQYLLPLAQRQRAHVAVTGPQHVEDVVADGHLSAQLWSGMADSQALLQARELSLAAVERDDLPVDDEAVGLLGRQRLGDLGVGAGVLLLVTGHQPDLAAGSERQASLAVELALEDPPRVGEPFPGERGQFRIQPARLIQPD